MMKDWQEAMLRERYADEKTGVLAKEMGVSLRTAARWAAKLGLRKSEAFLAKVQWEGLLEIRYLEVSGKRRGGVPKGVRTRENCGFVRTEESERKRIEAIRRTAWEERCRVLRGEPRLTRWKMRDYSKPKKDGKWQDA